MDTPLPTQPGDHLMNVVILNDVPLPLMPLYTIKAASVIVPASVDSIKNYLRRHKDKFPPAVYVRGPGLRRRYRMLSAYDLQVLRDLALVGPGKAHYLQLYPRDRNGGA